MMYDDDDAIFCVFFDTLYFSHQHNKVIKLFNNIKSAN